MNDEKKQPETFKEHYCQTCGQSTDYSVTLSRGHAEALIAIGARIRDTGINDFHPREMEGSRIRFYEDPIGTAREGIFTSQHTNCLSQMRAFGLVARIKNKPGHWLLTRRGGQFRRGEIDLPRIAIRSKTENRTIGYWNEHTDRVTIASLLGEGPRWKPPQDLDITEDGRPVLTRQTLFDEAPW
jgi:hypothetical protein